MDAAARHWSAGLRGYAAGALAVSALAVMFSGGDAGQWEWPASPTTKSNSSALPVQPPGMVFPANLAVGPADSRSIEDLIGESARESNLALADAHNLQTADHVLGIGNMVAALAALDARDHPGTSEAIVTAAATGRVRELGGSLTEAEVVAVLTVAGFEGVLFDEALRVSFGESVGWQPRIMGDGGRAYGLFQLHADPWAGWCGVTPEQLLEPVVNATCARRIVTEYEEPRGYPRWSNWTVKP